MKLNKKQIIKIQKNRGPYLLMDYATKVIPGKSVEGYKILKKNEWFFKVHWPGDPNMPGMLQVEALMQMSSLIILTLPDNKGKKLYLISADKLKFYKKVLEGERLFLDTEIISWKRGIAHIAGKAFVNDNLVSKAEFKLMLPDLINKYKK